MTITRLGLEIPTQKRKAEELELIHIKDNEGEENEEITPAVLAHTVKKHCFSAKSINVKLEKAGISIRLKIDCLVVTIYHFYINQTRTILT